MACWADGRWQIYIVETCDGVAAPRRRQGLHLALPILPRYRKHTTASATSQNNPSSILNFTGWEYLRFQARLCGLTRRNAKAAAERAVDMIGARAWIMRRIGYYTAEMLQRLALGVALVGAGDSYPALLVLDAL